MEKEDRQDLFELIHKLEGMRRYFSLNCHLIMNSGHRVKQIAYSADIADSTR